MRFIRKKGNNKVVHIELERNNLHASTINNIEHLAAASICRIITKKNTEIATEEEFLSQPCQVCAATYLTINKEHILSQRNN